MEILHKSGYVHLDIKPNNIAIRFEDINLKDKLISLVLFDFGKAYKYDKKITKNKKYVDKRFGGNAKYSSMNILKGGIPSPRDDLISLIYLLVFLYKGSLPWSFIEKNDRISYINNMLSIKKNFNILSYCGEEFKEIDFIYNDINKLAFDKKPNYSLYKNILIDLRKRKEIIGEENIKFKWEHKFYNVMREFNVNQNFVILNDTLNQVFEGFPLEISYSYISQYSSNK